MARTPKQAPVMDDMGRPSCPVCSRPDHKVFIRLAACNGTMRGRVITVRCRAFSGQPTRTHRVMVEQDGMVRVWDEVAGHYTTCHALSHATIRRIVRMI